MESHKVKKDNCPHCSAAFDRVTGVNVDDGPTENDLSVCIKCGNINRFDENIELVMAEDEFLEGIKENNKEDYDTLMEVVIMIKARL